jgi:hypothetical protein
MFGKLLGFSYMYEDKTFFFLRENSFKKYLDFFNLEMFWRKTGYFNTGFVS